MYLSAEITLKKITILIILLTRDMKRLIFLLTIVTLAIIPTNAQFSRLRNISPPDEVGEAFRGDLFSIDKQIVELQDHLQSLDSNYLEHFVATYHSTNDTQQWSQRITAVKGTYFVLVAKMYLYGLLKNPQLPQLKQYQTNAPYLAAYYYLKVAAELYTNQQAYYWLGLLEQFKLVPDKIIESNLALKNRTKSQDALYKHLKVSHLYNGQHNLFMAAALGYDPAALVLGHMNREPFGTNQNCTAALAYYLAVLKRNLFSPYSPKLVIDASQSLEEELFSRKPLIRSQQRNDHSFVMDTEYFDEQTISATLEQANRYYLGSRGMRRNLKKALGLFEKLSEQGNSEGKIMAGLMYFRGEGTPRNIEKAKQYFQQTKKDDVSEYMLLAMDYFQMFAPNTKSKALQTIKNKISKKVKLSHLMDYLIGSIALKGEIKEITHDEAISMIDRSATEGNPSARLLMAMLFTDGAQGLKYGCPEATKYLSEDAIYHPYFSKRVNTAEVALKRGFLPFSFFKYFQLVFNSYRTAFINSLYLLEMYGSQVLRIDSDSWKPCQLTQSPIYLQLKSLKLVPDVYTYLLNQYTPLSTKPFTLSDLDTLLTTTEETRQALLSYMLKKIVKRGVVFEKRGMLRYYQYKLSLNQGASIKQLQQILSTLASGDSSKLYVLEARYLLGQLYHSTGLKERETLNPQEHRKVMGEYNRAVKSELLGQIIFAIEQYRLTGHLHFTFSQSSIGQDLLTYIFILAIVAFVFYYLRSKRFDHFHKMELEKQLRRAQQNQQERQLPQQEIQKEQKMKEEVERDPDQPIITVDDPHVEPRTPQGIRIGSSSEEEIL